MALELGEWQETVYAFRRALHGPKRLEIFLIKYAVTHGFDWYALVERWELVPEPRLSAIERRLSRMVADVHAQGDPTLSRLATEILEAKRKKIEDEFLSAEKEIERLAFAYSCRPTDARRGPAV